MKLFSEIDVHFHDKWSEGADKQKLSVDLFGSTTLQHNLWSFHCSLEVLEKRDKQLECRASQSTKVQMIKNKTILTSQKQN